MPFAFLAELQRRFTALPSPSSISDVPAYGLQGSFSPIIAELVDSFNESPPEDEIDRAKGELAQVKDIMVQNVEQILSRGERIELLVDKTDNMAHQATAFRRGARTVRRQQFWRNGKIMILFILVGMVSELFYSCLQITKVIQLIIYMILASACGPALKCFSNS